MKSLRMQGHTNKRLARRFRRKVLKIALQGTQGSRYAVKSKMLYYAIPGGARRMREARKEKFENFQVAVV